MKNVTHIKGQSSWVLVSLFGTQTQSSSHIESEVYSLQLS